MMDFRLRKFWALKIDRQESGWAPRPVWTQTENGNIYQESIFVRPHTDSCWKWRYFEVCRPAVVDTKLIALSFLRSQIEFFD
jgi:hypothetical protein